MFNRSLFESSFIRLFNKDIDGITIVRGEIDTDNGLDNLPTPLLNFYLCPKLHHSATAHFNYAFTIYLRDGEDDSQYKILGDLRRFIMKHRNPTESKEIGITPGSVFFSFSDIIDRGRKGYYYTVSGEFRLNLRDTGLIKPVKSREPNKKGDDQCFS